MSFTQGAVLFSLLLWHGFLFFRFLTVRNPSFCLGLPRHRELGVVVGLIALFWSANHVSLMLEGGASKYQSLVFFLVPVAAGLAYYFLAYIFARALGGFLLLFLSWLLQSAFGVALPGRPIFSFVVYLIAIGAALLVATPWLFRDLLESAVASSKMRNRVSTVFALLTAFFLIFAFLG